MYSPKNTVLILMVAAVVSDSAVDKLMKCCNPCVSSSLINLDKSLMQLVWEREAEISYSKMTAADFMPFGCNYMPISVAGSLL